MQINVQHITYINYPSCQYGEHTSKDISVFLILSFFSHYILQSGVGLSTTCCVNHGWQLRLFHPLVQTILMAKSINFHLWLIKSSCPNRSINDCHGDPSMQNPCVHCLIAVLIITVICTVDSNFVLFLLLFCQDKEAAFINSCQVLHSPDHNSNSSTYLPHYE